MPSADLGFAIGLPPEEAIRYFESKGFAISFKWQDVWVEAHAKAFTVAGVAKLDILQDIRGALDQALTNGETLQGFQHRLQPVLEAKGWWGKGRIVDKSTGEIEGKRLNPRRLETIYRTNLQSAYMAGRYQAQLANAAFRPWWEYVAVLDTRTRPRHAAMHGRVFRYDDPFWRAFYPPNGWNCRCRVRTRSQRDIERQGIKTSSSEGLMEAVQQPIDRQGNTRPAPLFRDPAGQPFMADAGFGFNAGQAAYQPDLDRYPVDTARQYVRGTLTGPDFARWYQQLDSAVAERLAAGQSVNAIRQALAVGQRYPVAVLSDEYRQLLNAEAQTVWLSDDTLAKQFVSRDGQSIDLADYWRVQEVIERAQIVIRQGDLNLVFIQRAGRVYHAVIKATQSGKALFLTSFRESSVKAAEQAMKRGEIVRNDWAGG
ncbi:phage head morphogenesis protein [Vogesella mureinivorans]|uniref:phage head morphogenesis protein n=1 Tax=Vogesella mureinivorans TaxID=657276 RepID=UPI0011C90AFC|nr:phage minor head protein [Vogesella mureinivorans]